MRELPEFHDFISAAAFDVPWYDECISFVLVRHHNGERRGICKPLEFDTTIPQGAPVEPTFRLFREEAQALMNQLWSCNLRPTEAKASAGCLEATQHHLDDMRKIVFAKLEIDQP